MGRLVLVISDELEQKFREEVYRRYGMKKGNLTRAVEEAIKDWINKKPSGGG
jgi:hypothetical protein